MDDGIVPDMGRMTARSGGAGMTSVLVIDDHPIVLQGCQRLFEDAGVSPVHQAASFSGAFRLYRRHKPDVIIADLAIGSVTLGGLSFIRRLRLHDRRTPVLSRVRKSGLPGFARKLCENKGI
jgi:DNA-binding NarL/FixJ family response regulator